MNENSSYDTYTFSELTFDLEFSFDADTNCEGVDNIHEGVELSLRTLSEGEKGEWIPLMYYTVQSTISQPSFIDLPLLQTNASGTFILRGYRVPFTLENEGRGSYNVSICGDEIIQNPLQFRWLQTSYQENDVARDTVLLDNVIIQVRNGSQYGVLLEDCFNSGSLIK